MKHTDTHTKSRDPQRLEPLFCGQNGRQAAHAPWNNNRDQNIPIVRSYVLTLALLVFPGATSARSTLLSLVGSTGSLGGGFFYLSFVKGQRSKSEIPEPNEMVSYTTRERPVIVDNIGSCEHGFWTKHFQLVGGK